MRLLHISDLHATATPDRDQERIVEALLTDITRMENDRPFDLIVFSGDLGSDGTPEAFGRGRSLLLDPLGERLPGRPLVMVPGNHDVNRSRIGDIFELGLREKLTDRESVEALLSSSSDIAVATERLQDWEDFHNAWYASGAPEPVAPLAFIHTPQVEGPSVCVAALNTAWRAFGGDEDRGRLLLGEAQVERALKQTSDAEIRLVVMHHPWDWLADFDAHSARVAFESGGVFVLTGHDHTADPTFEITTRGRALYSRAGCLYARHHYSNSYTILDLDHRQRQARALLRRWWPDRGEFDQATDLRQGGELELDWPRRATALAAQTARFQDVLAPLAELAQEQSVLASHVPAVEHPTVDDLLIPPRFWPVPYRDLVDPDDAARGRRRVKEVDPLEWLTHTRVVLVSGDHHTSGVTSALLWLLERHFRMHGTHMPVMTRTDRRFSLGRLNEDVAAVGGRLVGRAVDDVPVLLAIDDTSPENTAALVRLVRFLRDHPNITLILGCHGDDHVAVAETLALHKIPHERAFLGPFGRRELRELVTRITGGSETEIVERVLNTIHRQHLPRNPLNIAALVEVLMREPDLTAINESGLIQSYVTLLLENPIAVDPEGLAMDYRRREHLLQRLAEHLVRKNVSRIARPDIEAFVLDYFTELGWRTGSAGQLVDSLIRRRVLSQDALGVGFRYPALLHLFAAKAVLDAESSAFAEAVLSEPIRYRDIIRHAAGLKRNDRALLERIGNLARRAVSEGAPVTVEQFDLMQDRHGWSKVKDFDEVRELIEKTPEPPTEEQLDELYEDVATNPPEQVEIQPFHAEEPSEPLGQLIPSTRLLASVLKSSELVPDISLKTNVLRTVINGWSVMTVMFAVKEDETGALRSVFEPIVPWEGDEETRQSIAEHVARIFLMSVMTFALQLEVGSPQLQAALERLLDDEEFTAETANALFAATLHALLKFNQWPQRLAELHEKHGDHPMVRELVRLLALTEYRSRERLHPQVEDSLENLLVEVLTPELPPAKAGDRTSQQNRIRDQLRKARTQERWTRRAGLSEPEDDVLLP